MSSLKAEFRRLVEFVMNNEAMLIFVSAVAIGTFMSFFIVILAGRGSPEAYVVTAITFPYGLVPFLTLVTELWKHVKNWIDDYENIREENPFVQWFSKKTDFKDIGALATCLIIAVPVSFTMIVLTLSWFYPVIGLLLVVGSVLAIYARSKKRRSKQQRSESSVANSAQSVVSTVEPMFPQWPFTALPSYLRNLDSSVFDKSFFTLVNEDSNVRALLNFLLANNSGNDNIYHSNQHMFGVAVIANYLYIKSVWANVVPYEHQKRLTMITAALFHDFGHGGGKFEGDCRNIAVAVGMVETMSKVIGNVIGNREAVISAIKCTEYPFSIDPMGIGQQCLRDADILYATVMRDPEIIMEKLRKEIQRSQRRQIDLSEMYDNQVAFSKGIRFFTDAGRELYECNRDSFLSSLSDYAEKNRSY